MKGRGKSGLKRPSPLIGRNAVLGAVAHAPMHPRRRQRWNSPATAANRRLAIKARCRSPCSTSLRWPGRPEMPEGNLAWTYMIDSPFGRFAPLRGPSRTKRAATFPFEVVGSTEPSSPRRAGRRRERRLSMDMRADDRAWLKMKLDVLANTVGRRQLSTCASLHRVRSARVPGVVVGPWLKSSASAASS